jgi:hypothetical protein
MKNQSYDEIKIQKMHFPPKNTCSKILMNWKSNVNNKNYLFQKKYM